MVWGDISYDYRTNIVRLDGMVNGVRYRDEVVQPVVFPFRQRVGVNFEFQHGNADPHVSRQLGFSDVEQHQSVAMAIQKSRSSTH